LTIAIPFSASSKKRAKSLDETEPVVKKGRYELDGLA
jgi:hypothetical protein